MKKLQNFNYHGHTFRCGHADSTMSDEDFVREFINKGFKKISFTDHCPHKDGTDDRREMRMPYKEKDNYIVNSVGTVVYTPPSYKETKKYMDELLDFMNEMNEEETRE